VHGLPGKYLVQVRGQGCALDYVSRVCTSKGSMKGSTESAAQEKAWREYLKYHPYSLTEWRDTWTAFKSGWDAAWEEAGKMVEDN